MTMSPARAIRSSEGLILHFLLRSVFGIGHLERLLFNPSVVLYGLEELFVAFLATLFKCNPVYQDVSHDDTVCLPVDSILPSNLNHSH